MNDILLSFILGLVQGLTEFLPISSSAHLLFPTLIFGSNDLGLYFDISVHAGTLIAVVYYFRNEIFLMSKSLLVTNNLNEDKNLIIQLIVATIPIVILGFIFRDLISQRIFSINDIAISNLIFASILLFAFLNNKGKKTLINITILGACFIGLFQCFALIPGASRSGAAITAGLLIGLSLKDASKFAFLLAIPTILGALTLLIFDLNNQNVSFDLLKISIGFFTSMIFAFFTIKLFLKLVEKIGMIPFVAYRFLLGILLFII